MPEHTLTKQQAKDQQRSQLHEDIKFLEGELKQANKQLDMLSGEDEEAPPPLPLTPNPSEYTTLRQGDTPLRDFFFDFTRLGRILGLTDYELANDIITKVSSHLRFALRYRTHSLPIPLSLQEIRNYLSSIDVEYQEKTATVSAVSQDGNFYGYASSSSSDAGPDDYPYPTATADSEDGNPAEDGDPEDAEDGDPEDDDPDQEYEFSEDGDPEDSEDGDSEDPADDDEYDYFDEDGNPEDDPYDHDRENYLEGYL